MSSEIDLSPTGVMELMAERDSLLSKCERLEGECAFYRDTLRCIRDFDDYSPWDDPGQCASDALNRTDCGKAILSRLEEARWLIKHSICRPEDDQRRNQWLKGQP